MSAVAAGVTRLVGPRIATALRLVIRGYDRPRWGNLRRTRPFSETYGFERGTPIDRYYLHRFLDANRTLVTGDVLEVQNRTYTTRFGHHLARTDTFDIVPQSAPTYLCDLADSSTIVPSDAYDCVLLPNTLQHFRRLDACLRNALRVVRPGGVILASAAGFVPLTADAGDYWRLSPDGWRDTVASAWAGADVAVAGHGNCLAAIAAQLGLAVEELSGAELEVNDPRYPVLTTILCRKNR
jgi:SAM-dependent methyltransferase